MSKRTSEDANLGEHEDVGERKRSNFSSPEAPQPSDEVPMDTNNNDLMITAIGRKGVRDEMQDRHIVNETTTQQIPVCGIDRSAFFGLFDGHAGVAAADFCFKKFCNVFINVCGKYLSSTKELAVLEKSMKKIFVESFKVVDDEFLQISKASNPSLKDGTTATILFLLNSVIYIANVGDSKAILCRQKPEDSSYISLALTVDHSPMVYEERMRIQKSGGFVKDGRIQGSIEVSRSIGDSPFKSLGITCLPDVKKITLSSNDKFVILACDGLWKVFSSDEAMKYVLNRLKSLSAEEIINKEAWDSIADDLSAEAIRRGCGDNVSVIIIGFKSALMQL